MYHIRQINWYTSIWEPSFRAIKFALSKIILPKCAIDFEFILNLNGPKLTNITSLKWAHIQNLQLELIEKKEKNGIAQKQLSRFEFRLEITIITSENVFENVKIWRFRFECATQLKCITNNISITMHFIRILFSHLRYITFISNGFIFGIEEKKN